jgi:hypothetical protein
MSERRGRARDLVAEPSEAGMEASRRRAWMNEMREEYGGNLVQNI